MEIRENLLFGGISQENIDKILVCSKSNIKRYAQGEKVFFQGDEPRRLFVLLKGRVNFVKNLFSGKKQFLDEACEGGIFGESCFLGEEACYGYDAEAACETEVLEIPWEYFHCFCDNTCAHHQRLIRNMLGILSTKEIQAMKKISMVTPTSLKERIANWLLDCLEGSDGDDDTVYLKMGREELADFLGVARPSLSRALMRLKEEGLIDVEKNRITVLDRYALEELAD